LGRTTFTRCPRRSTTSAKFCNVADEHGSDKELLAKGIISFAHRGHRDAALLRDRMLREIVSDPGEWPAPLVRAAKRGALGAL
jgi:hypothetical protein